MTASLLAISAAVSGLLLWRKQVRVPVAIPLVGSGFFLAQTSMAPAISEFLRSVASLASALVS
ncbi:hypothetical protein [Streptomyces sp. NRRL B-24484]|uniref:hypothetical protein n=1 Tax=Streptomyces sp. NRRL B-24484 TaxID=1463833 RepID=UPI001331AE02|nr:hypothetical protein [Streptomyces sp. NRRL B-24484]